MRSVYLQVALCVLPMFACPVARALDSGAPDGRSALGGFVALDAHYDSRARPMATARSLVVVGGGFAYFGLLNLFSPTGTQNADLSLHYTEQNLAWMAEAVPVGVNAQFASASGAQNDVGRAAITWQVCATPGIASLCEALHLRYFVNFHLLQTDLHQAYRWQMEHVYQLEIWPEGLGDRIYLYGFLDHNIDHGPAARDDRHLLIFEHQLNLRLISGLHALVQLRHEEFLPESTGLGAGLEYVVTL